MLTGLSHLLDVRRRHEAFSPFGTQRIERLDDRVFAVRRGEGTPGELLCVTNVTGDEVPLPVRGTDVLTGSVVDPLVLGPWGSAWVRRGHRLKNAARPASSRSTSSSSEYGANPTRRPPVVPRPSRRDAS